MAKSVDLSIITLSYNTKELTKKYLQTLFSSLSSAPFSSEVIVVDNASIDGSVEMITKHFPRVQLLANKKNIGFGAANNQASRKARGTYLLFLNSDIEVLDDAVAKLYRYAQVNAHITFLGGKLLNPDHSPQASCGPFLNLWVVFAMLFLKGEALGITRYSPNKPRAVDWISGACILTRKADFAQLNGFDIGIFLYMEEVELLYRAKQAGMQTWFYPDARFIHHGSASSREWKNPIMNLYRGLLYFYDKHKSRGKLVLLRVLLSTKAFLGIGFGKIFGNRHIYDAYQAALQVTKQYA